MAKDKMALIGLIVILSIVLLGIFAPYVTPYSPDKQNLKQTLKPPDKDFLMGTDHLGRCIFTRIVYGIRLSLGVSFVVISIIFTLGVAIGTTAGYMGGKIDNLFMRFADVILAFPGLVLAIGIAGILGPSLINIMLALAAVNWVGYARIARGLVLSLREKEYVLAARVSGSTHLNIIFRHILPNMISPLIVLATLDMGAIILQISGLSFLGLGAQPPDPEWGAMLNDGRFFFQRAPWLMLFPGFAILIVVMAFNLVGDGLRDVLDPKFKKIISHKRVM
ncbi:nickel transporter permease [Desulfitibacter alkalitolerans]|uniref:nickel transporter permease n=1 Tax=Desulfitibacter alkalitolerans TaxID=264641 RepID=UPI001FA79B76|nr:nickel transporter permease [Desulfitibacter alkalitolerans]